MGIVAEILVVLEPRPRMYVAWLSDANSLCAFLCGYLMGLEQQAVIDDRIEDAHRAYRECELLNEFRQWLELRLPEDERLRPWSEQELLERLGHAETLPANIKEFRAFYEEAHGPMPTREECTWPIYYSSGAVKRRCS